MADEFFIKEDLKVELYLPTSGSGVWNSSKWNDGSDWMASAGAAFAWTDIVATVFSAIVELGGSVENGYYVPATPNTMNIKLQSSLYDPANNKYMRPNIGIRLSYRKNPDTASTTWTVLFNGYIDTLGISYDEFGNNTVDITASSGLKRYLAKNVASFAVAAGTTANQYVLQWQTAVGSTSIQQVTSDPVMATETITETSGGELMDNVMQACMGMLFQNPTNDWLYLWDGNKIQGLLDAGSATNIFSDTHSTNATHFCISDIGFDYSLDDAFNTYIVSSVSAPGTYKTLKNQDLVDLYGDIRCEKELHIASSQLDAWLARVSTMNPSRKLTMVATPMIRPEGQLSDPSVLQPGKIIGVSVTKPGYTVSDKVWVTKTTHEITPDTWFATLEVWKGF